ncbi:ATP-dependent DNA ligase [Peribacillus deserti]|nr:RNA ligase family protein [Peribacillus deserti]
MLLHKSETPPEGDYIHQLKFDGFRCIFSSSNHQVRLFTRHQNECTSQFPDMQIRFPRDVVLDGEMIVLDQGKPCWESVMKRFQARKSVELVSRELPAHFVAFDILKIDGKDITKKPLEERLAILEQVVEDSQVISKAKNFDDGLQLFHAVKEMGLEGIVSKRKGSVYNLNTRSQDWIKVKNYRQETVQIAGLRKDNFGWSIIKDGKYVGVCEFVPPNERKAFWKIAQQIVKEEDSSWIHLEPLIRCKVKFQDYTKAGLMRSPSFVEFVL